MTNNHFNASSYMNPLVDLAARFPEQLFKQNALEFRFCEFEMIFSAQFWQSIGSLATRAGDSTILVAVVMPETRLDAVKNALAAFEFSSKSADGYLDWVCAEQPDENGDCIARSAGTILFQPPSRSWAIWADRNEEIAVLGTFDRRLKVDELSPLVWYHAGEALYRIMALRFSRQMVPTEFSSRLLQNYG